nr:AEC family transporter [Mesobacterium pallidum]
MTVLVQDVLPVFSMLALGFGMGRLGTASEAEARVLNRIAFLVMQPALILPLVAATDWAAFNFRALGLYIGAQALVFTAAYLAVRHLFRRDRLEAWLLAMATVFVNTLLYVWPISELIYGPGNAAPVAGIVTWDSTGSFAFFIITAELMSGRGSLRETGGRILRNPVLIAIALGIVLSLAAVALPGPVLTAATFAGAGAAPLTLFALGVILSGQALRPSPVVAAIAGTKLLVFPAVVLGALMLFSPGDSWTPQMLMAAAGPSGAMAFSLALLHGVRTDAIAPVIIWTSVLSLISLSALA